MRLKPPFRETQNSQRYRSDRRLRADIGGDDRGITQHLGCRAHSERAAVIEHVDTVGEIGDHLQIALDPDYGGLCWSVMGIHPERVGRVGLRQTDVSISLGYY